MIKVTLPYPPSINKYWLLNRNGHRRLSPQAVTFREEAIKAIVDSGLCPSDWIPYNAPTKVAIEVYVPDNRKRDLDNIVKPILDALTHAQVWEDDSVTKELWVKSRGKVKGGKVIVTVELLNDID